MPCNCKQCDCKDRTVCYAIGSRLKALSCLFDKFADGSLSPNIDTVFNVFNVEITNICGNTFGGSGGGGFGGGDNPDKRFNGSTSRDLSTAKNIFSGFLVKGNNRVINILGDLNGLSALDFVPNNFDSNQRDLQDNINAIFTSFLAGFSLCIPMPDHTGFCMHCCPVFTFPEIICEVPFPNEDGSNLSSIFAAIAQNFRYWAEVYGCN
jgi:hypothetical protein